MTSGRTSSTSLVESRGAERLSAWLSRHAAIMLIAAGVTLFSPSGAWIALVAALSFMQLVYSERASFEKPNGGLANQITTLRLMFLLTAAASMHALSTSWLWVLLAANVLMDVVDGYVARRTKQVSPFGAVFDREVDAVFVLVTYLYFYVVAGMPAWVLAPGLLPYLFRLSMLAQRDRPAPEHREKLAPFLAGANFGVLLIAVGAPPHLQLAIVLFSTSLVAGSFLVSFVKLYLNEYSAS